MGFPCSTARRSAIANPGLTDELAIEAYAHLLAADNNMLAASRASGIPEATLRNRVAVAKRRGLVSPNPEIPGYTVKSISTSENEEGEVTSRSIKQTKANGEGEPVPAFMDLKGLSRYEDGDGRVVGQWLKYSKSGVDPIEVAKHIAEAFDGMTVKKPRIDVPAHSVKDQLALYPLADLHIGMLAWGKESEMDWDIDIGVKAIRSTMSEIVARSQAADTAIILGVGDLLHSDNDKNMTARSGNVLDIDGRFLKVVSAACELMLDIVLLAKQKHKKIIVRILPGNHDQNSHATVSAFLAGVFREDKRVTVDLSPSPHFVYPFGDVLIAATHGHTMRPDKFQTFVSSAFREEWGRAKHVYGFLGHLHHRKLLADEVSGMLIEQLPAPVPADQWHWGAGYVSGRALSAFNFHSKDGMVGKVNQTMRRGDNGKS